MKYQSNIGISNLKKKKILIWYNSTNIVNGLYNGINIGMYNVILIGIY
jgi:hypothetical protein